MRKSVLVVDDEENMRSMLSDILVKEGYEVECSPDGEIALKEMMEKSYDFILCDIKMPRLDGLGLLRALQEKSMDSTIIMMSAYGTIDTAVEAMKLGAYDYISKPFKTDEIILTLLKAEERERLKNENLRLKEEISKEYSFENIVSGSEKMHRVFELIKKIADYKSTVLISGDSGTGKELVARAIHQNSSRKRKPFVAINCGAIPENLLESELFGHVRGAFTDAHRSKTGLFEEANGGTLFLDEIGELPLLLQVKLLRVLQDEEVRRVGDVKAIKVDVRVIAATTRDLAKEVEAGRFRDDLYYRLNVLPIRLPPLKERKEDIPILAEHFIKKFNNRLGLNVSGITQDALDFLT
ncbi:MAG: sigma-54-dependent transcriptional regulator, partial [Candidatus Glassbacteria bacterium]